MKKFLILWLALLGLAGCVKQKVIRVQVYTISTCGACQACVSDLEKLAAKYDSVYLTFYDLDETKNSRRYLRLKKKYHLKNILPAVEIANKYVFTGYDQKTKKKMQKQFNQLL